MKLKALLILAVVAATSLGLAACKGTQSGDLKEVKQQKAGDYTIVVLAPEGKIADGKNEFALEFRRASDNQPVDVGDIQLSSSMPMPGQPNMVASVSASKTATPGRYTVTGNFEMKGGYDTTVTFANGQKAVISLKVQ
jgi:predicted small secreted protein